MECFALELNLRGHVVEYFQMKRIINETCTCTSLLNLPLRSTTQNIWNVSEFTVVVNNDDIIGSEIWIKIKLNEHQMEFHFFRRSAKTNFIPASKSGMREKSVILLFSWWQGVRQATLAN